MRNQTIPQEYEPSPSEVEKYIRLWDSLDNYVNQEKALDKLFFSLCQKNDTLEDVLIKCSTLNDFYSTNIFDIHAVAKHILSIPRIDLRLKNGDLTLVDEIAHVEVGKETTFLLLVCIKILQPSSTIKVCYLRQLCRESVTVFQKTRQVLQFQ